MIKIKVNGSWEYQPTLSTFPGGEEYVCLPRKMPHTADSVLLTVNIRDTKGVMQLLLVKNALDIKYPDAVYELDIPYLPYARQDRVCSLGESHSLKLMAQLINSMRFHKVYIQDCHSMAGLLLVDNAVDITQMDLLVCSLKSGILRACDAIVTPDAGSSKKVMAAAEYFDKPTIQCLKNRNSNGSVSVTLFGDIKGKKLVVLDDICDGGATFISLAQSIEAYDPAELHLLVTHGLFSKGKDELLKYYKTVEALNDWTT